ncbi:migration and invasion-inhibitory protein isoform X1 [Apteryx mantelli]|uniref:Migration and invasion-inhibitory protein isoform X1 n=1 Tax=Apteryx mantelli TaxID=2696672 RepID=A0ABM4FQV7_9AVES
MELEHLKKLRQANQDLLERLKIKQEEIRKRLPSKPLFPASLHKKKPTEISVPVPKRGKENQVGAVKAAADPAVLVSVEPRAHAARAALCSSLGHVMLSRNGRGEKQQQAKMQKEVGLDSSFPGKEQNVLPVSTIITYGRETSRVDRDDHVSKSPEKESFLLGHRENRKQSILLHSLQETDQLTAHRDPSLSKIQNEETSKLVLIKEPITPKSILLTSQSKELKKEAGHVTFQSEPEEYTIPANSWSARPFLGYDWIAGLLDTNSSVAEKSDQYFAELKAFRQANKEACVHEPHLEPKALDSVFPEQEPDLITSSHKCVYCYRLNQRLFTVPVDSESACPMCKIPRTYWPPETREEPAYIRVSIPRSTLMPAYKYKVHRRKSFEPADNLALPSHCLVGWENVISSSNPRLSSLDLRTSLKDKTSHHPHLVRSLVSRVSGGTRTDQLLNLAHLSHFRFSSASQQREQDKHGHYRAPPI